MIKNHEIIEFWISQKNNWFIANLEKRREFDELIKSKYNIVYQAVVESFRLPIFTYSMSNTQYKQQVFNNLMIAIKNLKNEQNLNEIALIIILDQFTRHICRDDIIAIKRNTLIACEISIYFLETYLSNKSTSIKHNKIEKLDSEVIPWILMPLKHEKQYGKCFKYLDILISDEEMKEKVKNFNQDLIKKANLDKKYNKLIQYNKTDKNKIFSNEIVSLDKLQEYNSILEFIPICLCNSFPRNWFKNELYTTLKSSWSNGDEPKLVILSLSGGVDSMVSAVLLKRLVSELKENIQLKVVHINYHNRETSDLEQEFVLWFCKLLNLDLYVRHIIHVKRGECDRDFYEEMTKNVRFDSYRLMENIETDILKVNKENIHVVLGHNRDDVEENILNNIAKMKDVLSLHGMEEKTYYSNLNVNVWRPLLSIPKRKIFEFAHENNIPYLVNTTPTWSSRGRMRNKFIPALKEQFNDSIMNSLLYLADTFKNYSSIINEYINNINIELIDDNKVLIQNVNLPMDGWVRILNIICEKLNTQVPSKKSIRNLISVIEKRCKLKNSIKNETKINVELTKALKVRIENNMEFYKIK
jgi:tRNA(Ile)-lysidine synthetase-like protein